MYDKKKHGLKDPVCFANSDCNNYGICFLSGPPPESYIPRVSTPSLLGAAFPITLCLGSFSPYIWFLLVLDNLTLLSLDRLDLILLWLSSWCWFKVCYSKISSFVYFHTPHIILVSKIALRHHHPARYIDICVCLCKSLIHYHPLLLWDLYCPLN